MQKNPRGLSKNYFTKQARIFKFVKVIVTFIFDCLKVSHMSPYIVFYSKMVANLTVTKGVGINFEVGTKYFFFLTGGWNVKFIGFYMGAPVANCHLLAVFLVIEILEFLMCVIRSFAQQETKIMSINFKYVFHLCWWLLLSVNWDFRSVPTTVSTKV